MLISVSLFYRGNYAKTLPYAKGVFCTMCGKEDTCKNKLCGKLREKK